jgi:hypothetical protein
MINHIHFMTASSFRKSSRKKGTKNKSIAVRSTLMADYILLVT